MSMKSGADLESMMQAAMAFDRLGREADAAAAYRQLLASWPELPNCWYNLALLQRKAGEYSAALQSYDEALQRNIERPEEVHLNRGVIYLDYLHQYDAAEREFNIALQCNPEFVPALVNLARLHEDLGRRQPAAAIYERILESAPDSPSILARRAALQTFSRIDDPLIGRLQLAVTQPGISAADRADLEFALGRALDACGQYDAAFDAYRSANRHSREAAGPGFRDYDLKAAERFIDRLMAAFPLAAQVVAQPTNSVPAAPDPPWPIFVCGMFRSGSTLVEQLLAGHPQVRAGGELDLLPRLVETGLAPFPDSIAGLSGSRMESLAAKYVDMLRALFPDADYVTDKRPDNFLYIGLIKMLFPHAKIVHTVRDALDNCLSIYFLHLDQAKTYALDLMDIGHHIVQYRRLMGHWKRLFGADILDLNYDALVQEPKPSVERLLEFLGLGWDERCLSVPPKGAIRTASVWQAREPIYRHSSGRSRHYERQLRALRDYLAYHG